MAKPKSIQNMRTPLWLFRGLEDYLNVKFTLDAAAEPHNALTEKYFTTQDNGLSQTWAAPGGGVVFCNPPFRNFGLWVSKAYGGWALWGCRSVLVGPVCCSQSWAHGVSGRAVYLWPNRRINFLMPDGSTPVDKKGRPQGANRDTMIYLFGVLPVPQLCTRKFPRVLLLDIADWPERFAA